MGIVYLIDLKKWYQRTIKYRIITYKYEIEKHERLQAKYKSQIGGNGAMSMSHIQVYSVFENSHRINGAIDLTR